MTDIPIIYSAPMVLALLASRKTMTRRLAWRDNGKTGEHHVERAMPTPWRKVEPGDRLWVRENFWRWGRWATIKNGGKVERSFQPLREPSGLPDLIHAASWANAPAPSAPNRGRFAQADPAWHLRPNIFLERQHSRLTLIVEEVKTERLHEISEEDATAEGIYRKLIEVNYGSAELVEEIAYFNGVNGETAAHTSARLAFEHLWVALHGIRGWESNPEVIALRFTVHQCNIDSMRVAA